MEAGVKSGNKYMADAMEELGTDAIARQRGFTINDVRLNNGIYDVSKIRFGPKDFAEFNINKFMDNLGIGKATEDLGRDKMTELLGKKQMIFINFTRLHESNIRHCSIRHFNIPSKKIHIIWRLGVLSGVVIGGGMAAVSISSTIFLLLLEKQEEC